MNNVRRSPGVVTPDQPAAYRAVSAGASNWRVSASPAHCPRCASDWIERIWSMQQYTRDNWFRCDRCGHLFTAMVEGRDQSGQM